MDLKSEKLPANMSLSATDQKEFNKKVKQIKTKERPESGVIYLGHIPHGFFEDQMKGYFSQFGDVNKLRISRSKRTGNIKGYAFIEFASDAVAKIVASTMNNYLMFHKLLKCEYVPAEKVHPKTFAGANRKFSEPKGQKLAISRHDSDKSYTQRKNAVKKMKRKSAKTSARLAEMGIQYEFPVAELPKETKAEKATKVKQKAIEVEYEDKSSSEKEAAKKDSGVESENNSESEEEDVPKAKRKRMESPSKKKRKDRSPSADKTSKKSMKSPVIKSDKTVNDTPHSKKKKTTPFVEKKSSKSPLTGRSIVKPGQIVNDTTSSAGKLLKNKAIKQVGNKKKLKSKK